MSDDSKVNAAEAPPKDHEEDLHAQLMIMEIHGGATLNQVETYSVKFSQFDGEFFVECSDEAEDGYFISARLGPWQTKQLISFLRDLPKEPEKKG